MRKLLKSFVLLGFLIHSVVIQLYGMAPLDIEVVPQNPPNTPIPITNQNNLRFSTLKIETYFTGTRNSTGCGSGFLWEDPSNAGNVYFITNKHVAGLPCNYWNVHAYQNPAQPHDFDLYIHVGQDLATSLGAMQVKIRNPQWKLHQVNDVDLCAFLMNPVLAALNAEMFQWPNMWEPVYFSLNTLPQYCFPPLNQIGALPAPLQLLAPPPPQLEPEDDVVKVLMVGYPDGREYTFHRSPLFRRGIISSDFLLPFNGREEFVIDMESTPGSSGSPVLYRRKTNDAARPIEYYLLGIFFLHQNTYGYIEEVQNDPSFNAWERTQAQHLDAQVKRFKHRFSRAISLGNVIKASRLNLNDFI